jgi:hypothetical protein
MSVSDPKRTLGVVTFSFCLIGVGQCQMKTLIFVIGASGAGKTATLEALEAEKPESIVFCYFDRVGVPSPKEMSRDFGSGEEWQRYMTIEWTRRIKRQHLNRHIVFLDGQTRPQFIDEACRIGNVQDYKIILFDCSDDVREARLRQRGHPELVNDKMRNWAKYLRDQAEVCESERDGEKVSPARS